MIRVIKSRIEGLDDKKDEIYKNRKYIKRWKIWQRIKLEANPEDMNNSGSWNKRKESGGEN